LRPLRVLPMRPLVPHASALSDAEYDFYTASLYDITAYDSSSNDGVPSSQNLKPGSNIPPPPTPPSRRQDHWEGTSKTVSLSLTPTVTHIPPAESSTIVNPFTALSGSDANHTSTTTPSFPQAPPQVPQHPMLQVDPIKTATHSSHNPFSKPAAAQKQDDSPSSHKTPPLPPRKPPLPSSQSTDFSAHSVIDAR
jgi:hypothetical protein